jgi:hypothetical protein
MKSFFKNIQLKPKKNKDISYDDELVNNLTIKTKPKLKVIISLTLLVFIINKYFFFIKSFINEITYILFFFNYDSNNNKKNTTTKPNINTNAIAKNKQANNNNYIDLASLENPFVNKDSPIYLANNPEKMVKNKIQNTNLPAIPNYNQNGNLPPIPSFNQNNLPQVPAINTTPTSQIQGISSNEYGENIAIVDGQVVKEGDTLHGNTISKINNNGITFSNGNQISYNIAQ